MNKDETSFINSEMRKDPADRDPGIVAALMRAALMFGRSQGVDISDDLIESLVKEVEQS